MKRIGVFGGAFNPIHLGHITLSKMVKKHISYDKFMFVPTYEAAHKTIDCAFDDRCEMVRMCIDSFSSDEVSPIEKFLDKPTVTVKLIKTLVLSQVEQTNIDLIIGLDQFEDFKTWDEWETILNNCRLVVVNRGNKSPIDIKKVKKQCQSLYLDYNEELFYITTHTVVYGYEKVIILNNMEMNIPNISSTQIRKSIKNNEEINQFVTTDVINYINTKQLYRK